MHNQTKSLIESFNNLNIVQQARVLQFIFKEETEKTLKSIENILLERFGNEYKDKYQTWISILKIKDLMDIKYFILSDVDHGETLGKYLYNDYFDYDLIYIPSLNGFKSFDDC